LDILFSASKWPGIIYMLEAAFSDDEQIKEKAFKAINRWLFRFNCSFVLPSEKQTETIRKNIYELNEKLSPNMQRELLFVLP